MTIGPAPMIRIEEMSVRLGMLVSRTRAVAQICAPGPVQTAG
jgi:hypothetical protein